MLKNNRENYEQESFGRFNKENGIYKLTKTSTDQNIEVHVQEITANAYTYWDIIVDNKRLRK